MKQYKITVGGKEFSVAVEETTLGGGQKFVPIDVKVDAPKKVEREGSPVKAGEGTPVKAPMPGTVLKIKVKSGSAVKEGEGIIVLEAMKMENEIAATKDGIVSVNVSEGDKLDSGDVIATIL